MAGGRESVVTDYMLKLLGLDVCAGAPLADLLPGSAGTCVADDMNIRQTAFPRLQVPG